VHESVGHNKGLNIAPLYRACLFLLGCHICCSPFLLFKEHAMLLQSPNLNLLSISSVIKGNVRQTVHLNQLYNSMSHGSLLAYKIARKSSFGYAALPAVSESSPCICPCMLFTFICELILQNISNIGFIPAASSSSLFLSQYCVQKFGCHIHQISCLVYLDANLLYLISQFPVSLYFFWSCSPVWFPQIL